VSRSDLGIWIDRDADRRSASPRLKDAEISLSKLPRLYGELLVAMRRMFHVCRLVHADLSEYNILYHASHLYIIDVSQSVEQEHPSAFDFLRSDIRNVDDFFHRRSNGEVKTLGLRRTWNFIVDESVGLSREEEEGDAGEDRLMDVLREWLDAVPVGEREAEAAAAAAEAKGDAEGAKDAKAVEDECKNVANQAAVDDAVFFSSYIPRSLGEVYDPERDVELLRSGQGDKLIYAGVTGLQINDKKEASKDEDKVKAPEAVEAVPEPTPEPVKEAPKDVVEEPVAPAAPALISALADPSASPKEKKGVRWEDEQVAEEGEEDEDEDEDEDEEAVERKSRGFRHEDREDKKVRLGENTTTI
jgi:RIO kinase 1